MTPTALKDAASGPLNGSIHHGGIFLRLVVDLRPTLAINGVQASASAPPPTRRRDSKPMAQSPFVRSLGTMHLPLK